MKYILLMIVAIALLGWDFSEGYQLLSYRMLLKGVGALIVGHITWIAINKEEIQ